MAELEFEDFQFSEEPKDTEKIRVKFMKLFYFHLARADLEKIGKFTLDKKNPHKLIFSELSESRARGKFNTLLPKAFNQLKSGLNDNPVLYVHRNSGIPLIGNLSFGIVDRGTNMIEVKPVTGCNLNCVFCSVDEGKTSRKIKEIVVEKDYLVEELAKLLDYKGDVQIDVYINTHGESTLYADLKGLVKDISALQQVKNTALITNATMLSPKDIDELVEAGLTQLHVSLNSLDASHAKKLAGVDSYDVERVKKTVEYALKKMKVTLAPVWLQGMNDHDVEEIIQYAKKIGAKVGIQNFLRYSFGRNPVKELPMEEFFEKLTALEKKYGIDLMMKDHTISETKEYPKPFQKGEVVKARIFSHGRMRGEVLAEANGRVIAVNGSAKDKGTIRVKIVRDKNNIFVGTEA
jgi:hypothetical protein